MPRAAGTTKQDVFSRRFAGAIESLHARLATWSYGRHAHVDYAVGITEAGSQTFTCGGSRHRTRPGSVILFNPFELHDGHATTEAGVLYRMLYIPVAEMKAALADLGIAAAREPAFGTPQLDDPALFAAVQALAAAGDGGDPFCIEERLVLLAARLARLGSPHFGSAGSTPELARICDRLRADLGAPVRMSELAREAGLGRFELIRAFSRRFGMPPSTWLRTVRLEAAKAMLSSRAKPSEVAAATGFADQAHLTRWFRRSYGAPPAAFARSAKRATSVALRARTPRAT